MPTELVVLDREGQLAEELAAGDPHVLRSESDVGKQLDRNESAVWVASDVSVGLLGRHAMPAKGDQRIVVINRLPPDRRELLRALFKGLVLPGRPFRILPRPELLRTLAASSRRDRFVAGAVDRSDDAVLLYRGDASPLVVPFEWFVPTGDGTRPDFAEVEPIEYGQAVRLGDYEAATDALLYEFDPEYRRRMRQRWKQDKSFGASVRRLRLQRRLARTDFPGVTDKAVARIERNEVAHPHRKTLSIIAERLGVTVDELATY